MDNITILDSEGNEIPDRGFTHKGVYWVPEDYQEIDFNDAHIHFRDSLTLDLADIKYDGTPLSQATIIPSMTWDEITSALLLHFKDGPELIAFITVGSAGPRKVLLPTGPFLDPELPPEYRTVFANQLKSMHDSGALETIEDNFDGVLAWAEPASA